VRALAPALTGLVCESCNRGLASKVGLVNFFVHPLWSQASSAASTESYVNIDEMHAVHLARHLADLYERRRFTDLRVRHRTTALPERTRDCSTRPKASASTLKYAPRCGAVRSCSRCTRAW
jgi:hypothetical protein